MRLPEFSQDDEIQAYRFEAMACEFVFYLAGEASPELQSAAREAGELVAAIENKLSLYRESSDVTRVNRAKIGDELSVSPEMIECLLRAFDASSRFPGKFDPFLGWQSLEAKGQIDGLPHLPERRQPAPDAPEASIALDYASGIIRKLREDKLLDLGGIGKGYALDKARLFLMEWDVREGILDAGGSAFLALQPPAKLEKRGWPLKIGYGEHAQTIHLREGQALASSGEGYQPGHIAGPNLGEPDPVWARVCALAGDASTADAASTAFYLSDKAEAMEMLRANPGLQAYLFSIDGEVFDCSQSRETSA